MTETKLFYTMSHSRFRGTLINLNDDLGCKNLIDIIFLCRDQCRKNFSALKKPIDVFYELLDSGSINEKNCGLLAETIWRIGRKDLVKKYLVRDVTVYERHLQESTLFSAYRLMLHELCDEMVEKSMKYLVQQLKMKGASCNEYSDIKAPQHLFILMEMQNTISPGNQDVLIEMIKETRDEYLYDVLMKYGKVPGKTRTVPRYTPLAQHDCPPHNGLSPQPNPFEDMHQKREARRLNRDIDNMHIAESDGLVLERYPMTSSPRGICVIISNIKFYQDQEIDDAKKKKDREGGEHDLDNLKETWKNLGFTVLAYRDLTGKEMEHVMHQMGREEDHSAYNAFVCCILTHGSTNTIYGSDGSSITMTKLVNYVKPSYCPSLTEKPKLFFIQSCQGKDEQMGYNGDMETDGPENSMSDVPDVPNEADVLISNSTVSGFVSYRSKKSGSLYVNALCECLNVYAHKYDLMSILTAVNSKVSALNIKREGASFEQVPQPQMTLRKLVFFN